MKSCIPSFPDLDGKKILVTGASSGLGAHFTRLFCEQGAHVFAAARRVENVSALSAAMRDKGYQATELGLDVSLPKSVHEVLSNLTFDVVVNNAGATISESAFEHNSEDINRIIDTNLKGAFLVSQTTAENMKKYGNGGSIINVASILGHRVAGHVAAYAASKAGVIHLTKSWRPPSTLVLS